MILLHVAYVVVTMFTDFKDSRDVCLHQKLARKKCDCATLAVKCAYDIVLHSGVVANCYGSKKKPCKMIVLKVTYVIITFFMSCNEFMVFVYMETDSE